MAANNSKIRIHKNELPIDNYIELLIECKYLGTNVNEFIDTVTQSLNKLKTVSPLNKE